MRFRLIPVLLGVLLVPAAQAMTVISMPDAALLDQANGVVRGLVVSAGPAPDNADATQYLVHVLEVLKGTVPPSIDLRVPGSYDSRRRGGLIVPGAPRFSLGESVLLFVSPAAAGSYVPTQLPLGAFHEITRADGSKVVLRDLSGVKQLGTAETPLLRDMELFSSWIRNRGAGVDSANDYWAPSTANDTATQANFTTLQNPGELPSRWFEFDGGNNVSFFANQSGQANLSGGGFAEFQQGLSAWNNDPGSNVHYNYGGTNNKSGGLRTGDGVNTILFNDPNGEISDTFDCTTGGVVATGGFRADGGSHNSHGTNFQAIEEADIVINNGVGCFLSHDNGATAAEVFAHETGHTLGLGHSCGDTMIGPLTDCSTASAAADDALMRAFPHDDARGASLRADDRAGIAFLYPNSSSGGSGGTGGTAGGSGGGGDGGGGGGGALDLFAALVMMSLLLRARFRGRRARV